MRTWTELIGLLAIVGTLAVPMGEARGEENRSKAGHRGHDSTCSLSSSSPSTLEALESIQVETSDIAVYERFFSQVLRAPEVERVDHPQRDTLRGYCYRDVLIVVRQRSSVSPTDRLGSDKFFSSRCGRGAAPT